MSKVAASVSAWLFLPVAMLALGALGLSLIVAPSGSSEVGDAPIESTPTTSLTATPTASPTATASATATPTSTPSPTQTPTPNPDRHSCDQIRDTRFRSAGEREWFLNHCVTPTRAAPAVSVQGQDWRTLVCSYNWNCTWAMAVIACESGGNPNAYNPAGPYVGLFQVLNPSGSLFEPAANIAAAYSKYLRQGPGAWPSCP